MTKIKKPYRSGKSKALKFLEDLSNGLTRCVIDFLSLSGHQLLINSTGDKYQSAEQRAYQKEIEAAKGFYVIARTFEGFLEWYDEFIKSIGHE